MACDICGRGSCASWMHSEEEQNKYEKVITLFEKARELRQEVRDAEEQEEDDGEN